MKFLVALVLALVALVVITSAQDSPKEKRGVAGLAYPGYAGLGYSGLGYTGLGYSGLGYTGLAYNGLGYSAVGYPGYGYRYGLAAPHYIG